MQVWIHARVTALCVLNVPHYCQTIVRVPNFHSSAVVSPGLKKSFILCINAIAEAKAYRFHQDSIFIVDVRAALLSHYHQVQSLIKRTAVDFIIELKKISVRRIGRNEYVHQPISCLGTLVCISVEGE